MLQPEQVSICKSKLDLSAKPIPPYSNTGVLKPEISIGIDHAKFRIHQSNFSCPIESIGYKLFHKAIKGSGAGLGVAFRGPWTIPTVPEPATGSNYEHRIVIKNGDDVRATIQWGGQHQNGWVQFEFYGFLCRMLTRRAWIFLFRSLCKFQGNILRADLAIDDLKGVVFDIAKIDAEFKRNPFLFLPGYRKGGHKLPREWRENEVGRTLYMGKRTSTVYQRVYEKGKVWLSEGSSKGKEYPECIRWEIEIKRQKSEIENHVFHPDYWLVYALGCSRYLARLWDMEGLKATWTPEQCVDPTPERAAKALLTLSKQWGAVIGHLAKVFGSEGLVERIRRNAESGLESLTPYDATLIDKLLADLRATGVCASSPEGAIGLPDDLPSW